MKILALGATGAIGGQLARELVQAGHELVVTSRSARPASAGLRYVEGNARDGEFLKGILREHWDVVVDFMVHDTATFRAHRDMFLDATGQYVYLSSGRVFAQSDVPLTERSARLLDLSTDAAFLATDEYALAKARQEDLLRASGRTNWTIVRPYITFGDARFQLGTLEKETWLYRALKGRSIVFCGPMLKKWTTLTDGADVARMIAALVGNSAALGEDFNLTARQAMTWGEVLELYLDELEAHLGHRPWVFLQDVESFCQAANSVPQVRYDRMYDRRFDPSKVGALVDLDKVRDPRLALAAQFRAQLSGGGFLALNSRGEALRDRAAREHAALSEFQGLKRKISYLAYRNIPLGLIEKLRPS
ncbi:NAD-dependent epimerase/dehydratase family protein [Sinirhodobacter ferrireducens]|uniref:NAD-dependent epimerase/dehydratase family protein n=1 Tax=Paenirhodobacter ferrireducens TaxID=1215032 RepID=A0A443L549_9RHOB|nr:NAD-dependent epimerase/dehydratase family protein [Sinirhodobacter ferrireducens]RWR44284.1 NAD-dependent epimerase/dehydratase family protein [Sinirhodobacter ferrireducens]